MEAATRPGATRADSIRREERIRRLTTETKQAFKTTGSGQWFIARQAWLYVAIVAGAYFISRGLAKSGSHDPYTGSLEDGDRNGR